MSEGERNRIFPTYEILERTDPAEYGVLSPENKALYALIISAGEVSLFSAGTVRTVLLSIFPVETNTGAKLAQL
jgi:hypothetical protein